MPLGDRVAGLTGELGPVDEERFGIRESGQRRGEEIHDVVRAGEPQIAGAEPGQYRYLNALHIVIERDVQDRGLLVCSSLGEQPCAALPTIDGAAAQQ